MHERATGIVLRKRRLTETSLILHWLTKEHGRIATVAKGALRPKSPFGGKLDLFFECELSYARSRKSDLHTLREVAVKQTHPALREDIQKLRQASYAAALIEQTCETETPLAGAFELVDGLLGHLARQPFQPRNTFAFELKLLHQLGLGPELDCTNLSAEARALARDLEQKDWVAISELKPAAKHAVELRQFLHGFLIYHLGKIPKGRPV